MNPRTLYGRARGPGIAYVRQLQPAAWYRKGIGQTVTGSGVSQWDDQSGNARHLLQGTDAARPIQLPFTGTKYVWFPQVSLNGASSPDSSAFPTGDIDFRIRAALNDWTPALFNFLFNKLDTAGQYSFDFGVTVTTGVLRVRWSADGTTVISKSSTVAPTVTDGSSIWLRVTIDVDNGSGGNDVKFYTAADSETEPSSWTQLGTTVTTAGTTSIFNGTDIMCVGYATAGGSPMGGKVYRARIFNSIGGTTPVVDFNAADGNDGSTSFVSSSTGETWTVNKSGALPAYLVGAPWVMGNGTSHILATNAFTLNQPLTRFILGKSLSWTLNDYIGDGNAKDSAAIIQSTTTPAFKVSAGSAVGENSGLALNTLGVMCVVINGASSLTRVNLGAAVSGNAGAANAGGLTLFGSGTVATGFWNGMVMEDITFPGALSTDQQNRVIQYLAGIGGVSL